MSGLSRLVGGGRGGYTIEEFADSCEGEGGGSEGHDI